MSLFGQLFGGSFALDRSAPEAPSTREMRFTQLFLEVALSRDPVLPATAASPCTGGGTIATASDPADGVALAGATAPVLWILCHFDTGDRAYAYEVLNDPSTYHAGQKLARILSISDVSRHGSDDFGGVIVSRTTVELLDQDGHFRTVENTQTIRGRSVELFIADNATRLALGVAKRIGHFVIDDYQPRADFTFALELVGFIGSQRSAWRKQKFACSRLWPAGVFSDLPLELVNTPEPLWYGPINDESLADSASAAPVLTGDAARGSYLEGGVYRVPGYGYLTPASAAAIPTGLALAVGGAATGTVSANVPDSKYGVQVQAKDANGLWSDPAPFYLDQDGGGGRGTFQAGVPTAIVPDSTRKLTASCSAASGAVAYRFTLYYYYYGARPQQMLESATPSVDFTTSPAWDAAVPAITPGAEFVPSHGRRYYRVSAVVADGETPTSSPDAIFTDRGPNRPGYVQWLAVAGALKYRIYASVGSYGEPTYGFTRRWEVDGSQLFFQDEFTDAGVTWVNGTNGTASEQGAVPLQVAFRETVAGKACIGLVVSVGTVGIQSLFGSDGAATPSRIKVVPSLYGTAIFCPGKTGWPFSTLYRELGGRWYTVVYVDAAHPIAIAAIDGTIPMTANICGLKQHAAGVDGSGNPSPSIDKLPDQILHYMNNFMVDPDGVGPWLKGDWRAIATKNGIPLLRTSSADAVKTKWAGLVTGGLIGAWGLGWDHQQITVDDFFRMAARNCGIKWSENSHGQIVMTMINAAAGSVASFNDQTDILLAPTPTFAPQSATLINEYFYRFKRQYITPITNPTPIAGSLLPPKLADSTDWLSGSIRAWSQPSIDAHDGLLKTENVDFAMHRDGAAPGVLIARDLALFATERFRYAWTTKLKAYDVAIGANVLFSHLAGRTAGGDVNKAIAIDGVTIVCTLEPTRAFDVTLEGVDVTGLSL